VEAASAARTAVESRCLIQRVGAVAGSRQPAQQEDQFFYHPDHLGSSSYVTDLSGALYEHVEYFPFGETRVEEKSNTQRTPYLFTGKELDEETDLYYYGARYYDPRTSVWQNPDPILEKYLPGRSEADADLPGMGGVFKSLNLDVYTYSHQNPVRLSDPNGTDARVTVNGNTVTISATIYIYGPGASNDA
jgi:RHS repeat-associated protein